jgi:hypothetical protein
MVEKEKQDKMLDIYTNNIYVVDLTATKEISARLQVLGSLE